MESERVTRSNFVHHCIEKIGFGNFQILALAIIFTRVFTFSSMTSLVAILEPYLRCQMSLTTFQASWIVTAELFARIFSSGCIGRISDLYGRQRALFFFYTMHVIAAILNSLATGLTMIVITRAAIGLFSPCRAATIAYVMEALPMSKRHYMSLYRLFNTLGALFSLAVGVVSLRFLNWRWFVFIAEVVPSIMCSVLAYLVPESPRFLYSISKHDEAVAVLEKIAIMNGKDPALVRDLDEMASDVVVEERDQDTTVPGMEIIQRILVMSLFMYTGALVMYTINYGTMQFGENAEITACGDCAHQLSYNYRIAMVVAVGFSAIIAWILTAKCERIIAIRNSLIILSLVLIPYYWYIEGWALTLVVIFLSFVISPYVIVATVYENELLPTCYRSLGVGVVTSFFNFGVMCGGFLSSYVYHENRYICFGVLHVVCVIAIITACFVPWETKDKALQDR